MGRKRAQKSKESTLIYLPALTMLLLGCLDTEEDDEYSGPQFIYECVEDDADYACIDPDYYDDKAHLRDGYVMDSVALESNFIFDYGRLSITTENSYTDDDDNYSNRQIQVISSSIERVTTSGNAFKALVPGLTALVAIDEDDAVVDYMYISVEKLSDLELFDDDGSSPIKNEIEISEGETKLIRGIGVDGATYLRGALSLDCDEAEDDETSAPSPVTVSCTIPGTIRLRGMSEGEATVRISAAGILKELSVSVGPPEEGDAGVDSETGSDDTDDTDTTGGDTETETETATQTDTNTDTETAPYDAGLDAGVDSETDTATDTAQNPDTDFQDAGVDAGEDTETQTDDDTDSNDLLDGGLPGDAGELPEIEPSQFSTTSLITPAAGNYCAFYWEVKNNVTI